MLSLRSKIGITMVAGFGIIGALLESVYRSSSWAEPTAQDDYIGWIVFGIVAAATLVSIVIDVRKDRPIV